MIIFGHPFFDHPPLIRTNKIEEIHNTPPGSIIVSAFSDKLIEFYRFLHSNNVEFAIECTSIKEAIFAENLKAAYIIAPKSLSFTLQPIADGYLFDAKILALIENEEEIEEIAQKHIDGILFKEAIVGKS